MPSQLGDLMFVECLVKQELELGKLYAIFAQQVSAHRDFWFQMSQEEKEHAAVLRKLARAVEKGEVTLDGDRYEVSAIKESIDGLKQQTSSFMTHGVDAKRAFHFAIGTEEQILEHNFFEPFQYESPMIRDTMRAMVMATTEHVKRLKEESTRKTRGLWNLWGLLGP